MIIDCISDLHGSYPKLPGGDILIIAGDLTGSDRQVQYLQFREWVLNQDYQKRILVAGNHDGCIENGKFYFNEDWLGVDYLCDSGTEYMGYKIWGSPWTKYFEGMNPNCMAFTCRSEDELNKYWQLIPNDTDILVTHSPHYGMLDRTISEEHVGSKSLLSRTINLPNLKLHVFGHIHEGYGIYDIRHVQEMLGDPLVPVKVNSSHMNECYEPVNEYIRVNL